MKASLKQALEPFGMLLAGMCESIEDKTESELSQLMEACNAVSQTNCWCYSYRAAAIILPLVEAQLRIIGNRKSLSDDTGYLRENDDYNHDHGA